MLKVFSKAIAYLQGDSNYTILIYKDGRRMLKAETLSGVLTKFPQFIRIHKRQAINPDCVIQWHFISKHFNFVTIQVGDIVLELPIARRRVGVIKEILKK